MFQFCWDAGHFIESNVSFIFDVVAVIYAICLLTTLCTFREIPLDLMEKDEKLKPITEKDIQIEMAKHKPKIYYIQVVCISVLNEFLELIEFNCLLSWIGNV